MLDVAARRASLALRKVFRYHGENQNRHHFAQGRLCRTKRDKDGAPNGLGAAPDVRYTNRYLSFIDKAIWSTPYSRLSFKNPRTLLTSKHRRAREFLCVAESIPRRSE